MYFTVLKALQLFGYAVVDNCGTDASSSVTMLSNLHIAFLPLFINAFAMELVPDPGKQRARRGVFALSGASAAILCICLSPLIQRVASARTW